MRSNDTSILEDRMCFISSCKCFESFLEHGVSIFGLNESILLNGGESQNSSHSGDFELQRVKNFSHPTRYPKSNKIIKHF